MNVIQMILVIRVITYAVLPKSALPERRLSAGLVSESLSEATLDDTPTARKIPVALINNPDAMQMIG